MLLCKQKSTLSSGMAAPSESMDLCVDKIFSYAPIRRRQTSYQQRYYNTPVNKKSTDNLLMEVIFPSIQSAFQASCCSSQISDHWDAMAFAIPWNVLLRSFAVRGSFQDSILPCSSLAMSELEPLENFLPFGLT